MKKLLINIGNTNCTIRLVDNHRIIAQFSQPHDHDNHQIKFWAEFLAHHLTLDDSVQWVVASVVPNLSAVFAQIAHDTHGIWHDCGINRDKLPILNHTKFPEKTGIDRLINILPLRREFQSVVICDMGTALTFDYFTQSGGAVVFHGGLITAGAGIINRALNRETALLPLVDLNCAIPLVGTDTLSAIQGGIHHQIIAMVRHIAEIYAEKFQAKLVLTGGGAKFYHDNHHLNFAYYPDLTLDALAICAQILAVDKSWTN